MAKNQDPVKPVDSDSDSGEDDSSESDSEPEPTGITKKPPSLPPPAIKKHQIPSSSKDHKQPLPSSSDEGNSGSGSESDGTDPKIGRIRSTSKDGAKKSNGGARKPRSKPETEPVTPAKSMGKKRLAEVKDLEAKGTKRSKKKPEPEPEPKPENSEKKTSDDSKKVLFQRIWSEEDEIAVLKGMIDYAEKNKSDPVADLNAFHEFIKDNLHIDATTTQLQHKIRRFRQKYEKNKSKEKEGKDRNFSNAHEKKAYELSKLVWGNDNGGKKATGSPKVNKSPMKQTENVVEKEESEVAKNVVAVNKLSADTIASSNGFGMRQMISRIGMELFEGDEKVEGGSEWKRLRMVEMEVYMKKLEVACAETKLVLEALKADNH